MLLGALRAAVARPPALGAARRGLSTSRPALVADRVAHGFNSPGTSGTSVEMKEAGNPEGVKENEEAVQMHQFSEKMRFDKHAFKNAEKVRGLEATPGDTGPYEAISEASSHTEEGQTHGVEHQSPETLKHAREPVGEKVDHEALKAMGELPVEEAAARGWTTLPGSQNAMAPNQPEGRRGMHTSAAATRQGSEGVPTGPEGVPTEQGGGGIDPAVDYLPPQPRSGVDFDPDITPKPDTPDEEAPAYPYKEEQEGDQMSGGGGDVSTASGAAPGAARVGGITQRDPGAQAGGLHTWAARRAPAGISRGLRTLARAFQGLEGADGEPYPTPTPEGQPSMKEAADKAAGQPPNVGRESSPSPCAAEELESEPDSLLEDMVMEERVARPDVGGIAS